MVTKQEKSRIPILLFFSPIFIFCAVLFAGCLFTVAMAVAFAVALNVGAAGFGNAKTGRVIAVAGTALPFFFSEHHFFALAIFSTFFVVA